MADLQHDFFLTPSHPDKAEIKIKGSRFIASIYPISSEKEAWEVIKEISADYRDATHNCYAFKLDWGDRQKFRYSDAGEPAGTAGAAILSVIENAGITNVVLLVTRYFGGTKLGVGPLRRAYRDSAKRIIGKCSIITKFHSDRFSFRVPYTSLENVRRLLHIMQGVIVFQQFDEVAKYTVDIRKSLSEEFQEKMKQLLKGDIASLERENTDNRR